MARIQDAARPGYVTLDSWRETVGHGRAAGRYHVRKIHDRSTGVVNTIYFDTHGRAVDVATLQRETTPEDKISEHLLDAWMRDRQQRLEVIVWIVDRQSHTQLLAEQEFRAAPIKSMPELPRDARAMAQPPPDRNRVTAPRARINRQNGQTISAFLDNAQLNPNFIIHRYHSAPAVALRLSRDDAFRLARREDVRFIFDCPNVVDELPINVPAVLAPGIWSQGLTGDGVLVAVVGEKGPVCDNPYLAATLRPLTCPPNRHATQVAGIIKSTHTSARGVAYDVNLLSAHRCGGKSADLDAAADWALGEGATVFNISQAFDSVDNGLLNWSDIYFDYAIHASRVFIVKSAGNGGTATYVTSPGRGYNSVAVGNIDDRGTAA